MAMTDHHKLDPSLLPISVYQGRYWSKWAECPQSSAFNTSAAFEIRGELDKIALKNACGVALKAQEIMHATFSEDGSEQYHLDFSIEDVFTEDAVSDGSTIEDEVRKIFNRPYDLASGPLLRFHLGAKGDRTHYFVASSHHVITDASWVPLLISQISSAYAALVSGLPAPVPRGPPYATCIQALHAQMTPERRAAARAFWTRFLAQAPRTVAFPRKPRHGVKDLAAESVYFDLDEDVTEAAKEFSADCNSTLFIVLAAMYVFLLAKYAAQEVVFVSYPINVRPHGFERVAGCFVNLALLRATVQPDTSLRMLVDQLTRQRKDVRSHWLFPLRDLVHVGGEIDADVERTYFSVFFGETYLNGREFSLGDLVARPINLPWSEEFDRELRLLYDASDDRRIRFRMDFRCAHYDGARIREFTTEFRRLLARAMVDERPLHWIADDA
jgi:hypothetical protein